VDGASTDPNGQWYGKNWVALGTALTSEEEGTYVTPLAKRTGLNVTNLGIPGGTASGHILKAAETADLSPADLITVEFGVNDWGENCPLGKVGDTVPYLAELEDWDNGGSDDGAFAGSCYQIFTALQKRAPQAVVVFLTDPTGREYSDEAGNCSRKTRNDYDLRQWDYAEVAMATARYTGIRVIDAGSMSMINQDHPQYLKDQIHHTDLGGQQYALTVWLELKDMAPLLKAE
jgi:lysophospholipase L1-like esterase